MNKRKDAGVTRQATLCMLYAIEAQGDPDIIEWPENIPAERIDHLHAQETVAGIAAHKDTLDVLLSKHCRDWRMGRLAWVDASIMRLALYEMSYDGLPAAIAINEALELAKTYGSEGAPKFIHGVLAAYLRSVGGTMMPVVPRQAQPKKKPEPDADAPPKRRGRPPKAAQADAVAAAPKRRGRPPKAAQADVVAQAPKRRGRPPKAAQADGVATEPKRRGRPPKAAPTAGAVQEPKRRGRPPKAREE